MRNEVKKSSGFWLLWLPIIVFLLKDISATIILLSNEPGITEQNVRHYAYALLPGSLFVVNGSAPLVNLMFGTVSGVILYLLFRRRF